MLITFINKGWEDRRFNTSHKNGSNNTKTDNKYIQKKCRKTNRIFFLISSSYNYVEVFIVVNNGGGKRLTVTKKKKFFFFYNQM